MWTYISAALFATNRLRANKKKGRHPASPSLH